MNDLRRIHYVAEHYHQLQGLRLLPLGAAVLLAALAGRHAAAFGISAAAACLLLLGAGVVASFPIAQYYERQFGRVAAGRWRAGAVTLIASATAVVGLAWLQGVRPAPVSLPLLFLSIMLARLGLVAGRLRVHYVWIALACGTFALLPLVGVPPALRAPALDALIGGSLIVAAIGDHRVLRRVMSGPPPNERTSW